ncbi:MAG TPA: hypothetical protein VMD53_15495 [Rhizomicrobium sp.]|nr:hypothetical protein [Rhizomicrobium sp.]
MIRIVKWSIFAAFAAAALSGGAYAGDDDDGLKTLIADCGGPDVKSDDIDSCLERAREIGETSPSPQLQSLTARLERMAERGDESNDLSKAYMVGPQPEQTAGGGTVPAPATAAAAPHGNMH